jgi:hypothetical protein
MPQMQSLTCMVGPTQPWLAFVKAHDAFDVTSSTVAKSCILQQVPCSSSKTRKPWMET